MAMMINKPFLIILTFVLAVVHLCTGGAPHPGASSLLSWHKMFPNTPMPSCIRTRLPAAKTTLSDHAAPTQWGGVHPGWGGYGYASYWVMNLQSDGSAAIPNVEPPTDRPTHLAKKVAVPIFFLQKSLEPGSDMNFTLMSMKKTPRKFRTRFMTTLEQSESLHPFSISNFNQILQKLSLKPPSRGANVVRRALELCERPTAGRERRCCALTLESMINCSASILGTRKMHVLDTTDAGDVEIGREIEPKMYRVGSEGAKLISLRTVACHDIEFPNSALFYCHELRKTSSYTVLLEGDDGRKVNAATVCHFDTSYWNPNHESFQMLGVEPGTVPICHFLSDGFAWVPDY